ncbi:RDD family protein [Cellulomonas chitinilytica]|uniref:RDD family protein n=1 Tax=Cellulomonas chitinilytica TaxID=398759 RepID=UPI0019452F2D|nr:RDD family protein [Cellulomonas chitinilytica]
MSTRSSDVGRATAAVVAPGSVAPIGRRVLAYAVDATLLLLASVVGFLIARAGAPDGAPVPTLLPLVLCLAVGVGQWLTESFTGATAGNALLGIRTVSVQTGQPAGLVPILVRQLVVGAGALACVVGQWVVIASGVWDTSPSQRGWHDKAAGTLVLRAGSVSTAARGVPGPAAWDDAVARVVGGPGGAASGSPRPPVSSAPPVPAVQPVPVALVPISRVPGAPPPVTAPAPEPDAPVPAAPVPAALVPDAPVPDALVPAAPVPDAPVPDALVPAAPVAAAPAPGPDAPAPAPVIEVPGDLRPAVLERPLAPEVIAAPDLSAPAPIEVAPPPAALIQGPPPVVRSRRDLRLDDGPPAADPPAGRPSLPDLGELELTRMRESAPAAPARAPVARLVFDTGERLDVVGDGLVGRSPAAEDGVVHVVAIDDPERSISKVHLAFGPTPDGGVWVMDRGSTNGTVLVARDGTGVVLPAGARVAAPAGSTIRFGQRSVRVDRA